MVGNVNAQTGSHRQLLNLGYQVFLGVPDVLQGFFRPHPVNLEVHVLRDYSMCPVTRNQPTGFVQDRHYLKHGSGSIHREPFLRYPLRPQIPVRRRIEVDGSNNAAIIIQDVDFCQAAFTIYSALIHV